MGWVIDLRFREFLRRLFPQVLLLLAIVAVIDFILGSWTAIVMVALGFILAHAYHLWELVRLRDWLRHAHEWSALPELTPPPEARGAWGDAFVAIFRLHRAERVARRHLHATLEHLRQAAEALPDGVILLDKNLRIEWMNPQSARNLGLDPQRDRGTLITHLIRDPIFINYLATGGEAVVLQQPVETARTLSLTVVPFAERGHVLISRDISAIERTNTIRRDFIANVSHELRTPLTVLVGFLETLLETTPAATLGEATHQTALKLMSEQVERMQHLVDDLLTLSLLDERPFPDSEESVDLPAMITALIQEGLVLSAGRHSITSDIRMAAGLRGNYQELHSAFSNLLSNAVRYTPEGGKIILGWRMFRGQAVVEVTDTGVGIAVEHIPRLTERFYRVDKGRSSATGGTGLGLAIVKHILSRHSAKLEIQSTLGKGSTFRAIFPSERIVYLSVS